MLGCLGRLVVAREAQFRRISKLKNASETETTLVIFIIILRTFRVSFQRPATWA